MEFRIKSKSSYFPGHVIVAYPSFYNISPSSAKPSEFEQKPLSSCNKDLSIYFHIPWCEQICSFCGYSRTAGKMSELKIRYLKALKTQIDKYRGLIQNSNVRAVYIGGGTPTTLSITDFKFLFDEISPILAKNKGVEFTVEVSPETIVNKKGKEKLEFLRESGVNRISLGVESLDHEVLKEINRFNKEMPDVAIEALNVLEKTGFQQVNVDLMYGLPTQTASSWLNTLERLHALPLTSITTYNFRVKESSLEAKRSLEDDTRCTSDDVRKEMHSLAYDFFLERGYSNKKINWYFRNDSNDFAYLDNMYRNGNLLGIGVSAFGYLDNNQFFNVRDTASYINGIESQKEIVERNFVLDKDEEFHRAAVFGLRNGIDVRDISNKYNKDFQNYFKNQLSELLENEYMRLNNDVLSFTKKGLFYSEEISELFYSSRVASQHFPLS